MDIAIITETWLEPTGTFKFTNYNIYRKDGSPTIVNKRRGGILITIHKDIPQPTIHNIEFIVIKLKITSTFTVGAAQNKNMPNR